MTDYIEDRAAVVETAIRRIRAGESPPDVKIALGKQCNVAPNTIGRWIRMVRGQPRTTWSQILASKHSNSGNKDKACSPEAFEYIKVQYEQTRSVKKAYRSAIEMSQSQGWKIPSQRTIQRRFSKLGLLKSRYDDFDI